MRQRASLSQAASLAPQCQERQRGHCVARHNRRSRRIGAAMDAMGLRARRGDPRGHLFFRSFRCGDSRGIAHHVFGVPLSPAQPPVESGAGWLISIPFSTNYRDHWERGHVIHHQHPLELGDPQQENILTGRAFLIRVARMALVPGYVFLWNPSRKYPSGKWIPFVALAFWGVMVWATASLLCWYAPVAFLVAFQVTGTLNQLKGALEHGGAIGAEPHPLLRSRSSLFWGRRLIMPFNISLHFEHHLNFNVPWYLLLRYHRQLHRIVPSPLQPFVFNRECWQQLMGRCSSIPVALLDATAATRGNRK